MRLRRLEERFRKKKTGAPTRAEFDDAAFRDRVKNVYSAKLKLYRMSGREDELWDSLSDHDRETLENDTPEQRAKDADVMRRSEGVHWQESGHAARAKLRLRSMERVTVME